ncbi:hypothetical protein THRCLA_20681 [Thraustotheca clavata]|uniref:Uncharacterized protein n=1 Tax=Thraustotheca clavata TaxID=74557 RepID=A0A1W0A4Y5_9STRA|nr:hypothetical protein THRCLA_20681 [Thraustotheca clavata]
MEVEVKLDFAMTSVILSITSAKRDGAKTKFALYDTGEAFIQGCNKNCIDMTSFLNTYSSVLEIVGKTSPSQIRVKGTSSNECHHVQIKLRDFQRRLCVYGQPIDDASYQDRNDRELRQVPREIATLFQICRENGWMQ